MSQFCCSFERLQFTVFTVITMFLDRYKKIKRLIFFWPTVWMLYVRDVPPLSPSELQSSFALELQRISRQRTMSASMNRLPVSDASLSTVTQYTVHPSQPWCGDPSGFHSVSRLAVSTESTRITCPAHLNGSSLWATFILRNRLYDSFLHRAPLLSFSVPNIFHNTFLSNLFNTIFAQIPGYKPHIKTEAMMISV